MIDNIDYTVNKIVKIVINLIFLEVLVYRKELETVIFIKTWNK